MTWEITGSTAVDRFDLKTRLGELLISFERLDSLTFNVTVPDERDDQLVEWAEERNLPCRLV